MDWMEQSMFEHMHIAEREIKIYSLHVTHSTSPSPSAKLYNEFCPRNTRILLNISASKTSSSYFCCLG